MLDHFGWLLKETYNSFGVYLGKIFHTKKYIFQTFLDPTLFIKHFKTTTEDKSAAQKNK